MRAIKNGNEPTRSFFFDWSFHFCRICVWVGRIKGEGKVDFPFFYYSPLLSSPIFGPPSIAALNTATPPFFMLLRP